MSETTEDERNAASPVVRRTHGDEAGTARPLGFVGLGAMGLPMAASAARTASSTSSGVDLGDRPVTLPVAGSTNSVNSVAAESTSFPLT